MSKVYAWTYFRVCRSNNNWFCYPFHLSSSSYIFIKLSWTTTWPKSLLLMRVDGISILKSFMLKRNGQKQSWSHLWLTIVRTLVFFFLEFAEILCSFFFHPQILFSSFYIASSITVMCIPAFSPTSTIASIHMKIVANFSITFSVRPIKKKSNGMISHWHVTDSEGPVQLELPEQWLWDIIDEFIYQYQVFCTWRSKVTSKTQDELAMLAEGGPVRIFNMSLCRCLVADPLNIYRFGVHIVSWMFSIPSCKNLKSMNISLPNEKENHLRKLRTSADLGISYLWEDS